MVTRTFVQALPKAYVEPFLPPDEGVPHIVLRLTNLSFDFVYNAAVGQHYPGVYVPIEIRRLGLQHYEFERVGDTVNAYFLNDRAARRQRISQRANRYGDVPLNAIITNQKKGRPQLAELHDHMIRAFMQSLPDGNYATEGYFKVAEAVSSNVCHLYFDVDDVVHASTALLEEEASEKHQAARGFRIARDKAVRLIVERSDPWFGLDAPRLLQPDYTRLENESTYLTAIGNAAMRLVLDNEPTRAIEAPEIPNFGDARIIGIAGNQSDEVDRTLPAARGAGRLNYAVSFTDTGDSSVVELDEIGLAFDPVTRMLTGRLFPTVNPDLDPPITEEDSRPPWRNTVALTGTYTVTGAMGTADLTFRVTARSHPSVVRPRGE